MLLLPVALALALPTQGPSLSASIDQLLDVLALRGAVVGVYVGTADGTSLYERGAQTRMTPASNQKLLAIAYALARFGPTRRFQLRLWKRGKGWYLDAPGYPTATYAELAGLGDRLGIRRSDPVWVNSAFRPLLPPSWEWDDLPNKYAAKPSALTVDRGSFELWAVKGKPVLRPVNYGVKIVRLGGSKRRVDYDPARGVVRLYGPIPNETTRLDTLAVPDPEGAAVVALGGRLERTKVDPPSGSPAATLLSPPLIDIAAECLQKSDNNLAENLLLMAAASEGPLGDDPYETAAVRLTHFLVRDAGCESSDVRPIDGSGLSRHNLVTPRGLAKLLVYARAKWGDIWLDALASPGKGTLESRMANSTFRGKTGSLNSVSALSGYLVDSAATSLVLVLVFNQTTAPASEIRSIQDAIVRKIETHRDGTVFDPHDHREGRYTHQSNPALHWHRSR